MTDAMILEEIRAAVNGLRIQFAAVLVFLWAAVELGRRGGL